MTDTLLDQINERLDAALAYNENAVVAPVVLLWPDEKRQFEGVVAALRGRRDILQLGELDENGMAGPAYWIRCAVARTAPSAASETVPVLYLPGVGRHHLRAVEECPDHLAPLAELQYRGDWFAHPNGKDWTLRSLLSNPERGLGLSVAEDATTNERLQQSHGELLERPMRQLASQHIDAEYLNNLLNPDPIGMLLEWLDDPQGFRERAASAQWAAFLDQCRNTFSFDPEAEGEVIGGRRLGERDGEWAAVWQRFVQDPQRYAGIEERLRLGKPTDELFPGNEQAWPQDNEEEEGQLRSALVALDDEPPATARKSISDMWDTHERRRRWVWAQLDQAPLAFALEHLHRLAELTKGGAPSDLETLVEDYTSDGWKADDAFLKALASVEGADREPVTAAALAVYRPWLDALARAMQAAVGTAKDTSQYPPRGEASTEPGVVTLFVDGLRLDTAHRLADTLGHDAAEVTSGLAALPTVTATAKAALTPVPDGALASGKKLAPARATSGADAGIGVLRTMMEERGGQVLEPGQTGDPSGWAWAEAGEVDARGHQFGAGLVDELDREIEAIARRVRHYLAAGWQEVHVVTDHGWLLLPGELPKTDLPIATAEIRKGRCARLKPGADVDVDTVSWHWDSDVRFAVSPGITCFEAGKEYEHGGISPQECVVPQVTVRAEAPTATVTRTASITAVKWLGLMCRVRYDQIAAGATLDIRAMPADPATSVATATKETTTAGKASLYVADEDLEGEDAYLVIVGPEGSILAQRDVTIGQNR